MARDLAKWAKQKGVKYFMVSYTDLFGAQRAKLVPTQAINEMAVDGAGFAGFATWLDLTPAHPDLMAVPDADSAIQLPWKKDVAWVAARATMEGKLVSQAPRNVLERLALSLNSSFFLQTVAKSRTLMIPPKSPAMTNKL
jgi:glutamate---methylamine ligase